MKKLMPDNQFNIFEKNRHPLAEFFKRYKLTYKDIAKYVGAHPTTISHWFNGYWTIPPDKYERLIQLKELVLSIKYPGQEKEQI